MLYNSRGVRRGIALEHEENYLISPPTRGPRGAGLEVAAGAYTDIISIVAPASAKYGAAVSVTVKVKNLATYAIYISVTGRYDGVNIVFSPDFASVGAGATYSFTKSFTMPNKSIKLEAWSWYWDGAKWYQDDYEYVNIALAEVYKGTISKKELEYDSARASIPASNISLGKKGLVHIWGRNDMTTSQKLGISWIVKDPTGLTVESYTDWETGTTSPGATHEFIGGRFDLKKTGTWTIAIALFMAPASPVQVASYNGTLCAVISVVPEYKGSIARKELEYDGVRGAIPVY